MTRPFLAAALVLLAAAVPAAAPEDAPPLLCLGSTPPFLLAIRTSAAGGTSASFDYLGDGRFAVDRPPRPGLTWSRHRLRTARGPIPFDLTGRACPALGMTFPVAIEMAVPSSAGPLAFRGCCVWQDG